MSTNTHLLFPELTPFETGHLAVSDLHHIYYEQCGNPNGQAVVFLHGGPGSGCNPNQRRFFDPAYYRIILLDQRGCGRSTPLGCVTDNTISHLVDDIEQLKLHLGINKWHVFGGSWGSTLAIAYALAYTASVSTLILRGIFLSRASELAWFLGDVKHFYPEAWQCLLDYLAPNEQDDPLNAYAKLIFSDDTQISVPAAVSWNAFESSIMTLLPPSNSAGSSSVSDEVQVARARVQLHYIMHMCFIGERDVFSELGKLAHIPTTIVQGRYDMVCPPRTAWELAKAMPHAEFYMIPDAGHSAMERGVMSALVAATERYKTRAL